MSKYRKYILEENASMCKGILCLIGINLAFLALSTSSGSVEWMIGITGLAFVILVCVCFQVRGHKIQDPAKESV